MQRQICSQDGVFEQFDYLAVVSRGQVTENVVTLEQRSICGIVSQRQHIVHVLNYAMCYLDVL